MLSPGHAEGADLERLREKVVSSTFSEQERRFVA